MLGKDRVDRIASHIPGKYQGTPIAIPSQPPPSNTPMFADRPNVQHESEHLPPDQADKELRGLIDSMVDVDDVNVHEAVRLYSYHFSLKASIY